MTRQREKRQRRIVSELWRLIKMPLAEMHLNYGGQSRGCGEY